MSVSCYLFLWFDDTKQRRRNAPDKAASARGGLVYTKKEGAYFAEENARFVENGASAHMINR
ncbi:MAG: hypothetical protein BGO54_17570 [Sphingobacteriales bacterium 46-32]|jgi:hypothetical protein|nr:MAG: hypothetical protein BGO54_17570 [Sphingobacteriales bacterium 46-32]